MWTVSLVEDPLPLTGRTDLHGSNDGTSSDAVVVASYVVRASCSYDQLVLNMPDLQVALEEGGHVASVALADYIARELGHDDVQYQCLNTTLQQQEKGHSYHYESSLEPLDRLTSSIYSSRLALRRRRQELRTARARAHNNGNKTNGSNTNANGKYSSQPPPPYVLERTDIWCCDKEAKLHVDLRLITHRKTFDYTASTDDVVMQEYRNEDERLVTTTVSPEETLTTTTATAVVASMLERFAKESLQQQSLVHHIAMVVLQERLRAQLDELQAVSFVSNNAILPRKSGASQAPMSSPPAIPFMAPTESDMHHKAHVEMGRLAPFFVGINCNPPGALATTTAPRPPPLVNGRHETLTSSSSSTIVSLEGLLIPRGVVLICGGGYHGKSTLLRAIAAGVYNKIPGDGREFCVTIRDAMTIRAEDGRYVNNCNVSAFIANLPLPPPFPIEGVMPSMETKKTIKTDNASISAMLSKEGCSAAAPKEAELPASLDTMHFSTGEASGSTSQAANVVEAVEMGCKAFLVDEDVSAANFMARDGRMRALVMDESITPLLYRVNGLYQSSHGISSIVVVGGVGDWLDVPNKVILMDRYLCKDATAKARSISRQFSHGHVEYGGRGVVHRLDWPRSGTPNPRRPSDTAASCLNFQNTSIALMDGGHGLHFHVAEQKTNAGDDCNNTGGMAGCNGSDTDDDSGGEERFIDLSRCEQLLGRKAQLYGCGICALLLLDMSKQHPDLALADLLAKMDKDLNDQGFASLLPMLSSSSAASAALDHINKISSTSNWKLLVETLGCAYRPRRYEVGQAVCRLRGITFEELPVDDDGSEAAAKAEEERKRKELLDMWNARRKNKLHVKDTVESASSESTST